MHNCTVTNALIRCSDNELGPSSLYPTHADPVAWDLIHQYAVGMMSLPDVETALSTHLGDHYVNTNWEPVLKAIMESEDDESALDAVATHRTATQSHSGIKICIPARQLASAEAELMESVCWLKERNRIHGPLPSVDNVVEPPEERDLPEPVLDGSVGAIADEVCREAAIANGEIADEADNGENDDEDSGEALAEAVALPHDKLIELCKQLEAGCMYYGGDAQFSFNLSRDLIKFRALLQWEALLTSKQTTLDAFFIQ